MINFILGFLLGYLVFAEKPRWVYEIKFIIDEVLKSLMTKIRGK